MLASAGDNQDRPDNYIVKGTCGYPILTGSLRSPHDRQRVPFITQEFIRRFQAVDIRNPYLQRSEIVDTFALPLITFTSKLPESEVLYGHILNILQGTMSCETNFTTYPLSDENSSELLSFCVTETPPFDQKDFHPNTLHYEHATNYGYCSLSFVHKGEIADADTSYMMLAINNLSTEYLRLIREAFYPDFSSLKYDSNKNSLVLTKSEGIGRGRVKSHLMLPLRFQDPNGIYYFESSQSLYTNFQV